MSRPMEAMSGRELATAMLDAQALVGRPLSLDDALLAVNAAWTCPCTGALWLRGSACRLCYRCRCGERADIGGRPCPTCGHQLD